MAGRLSRPGHSSNQAGRAAAAGTPQTPKTTPPSSARNRPPTGRITQKYKQRDWKRQQQQQTKEPTAPSRPIRPGEPGYELTKKGRQQQLFNQLEKQYGPNFAETDVRLYLKKRQLNAVRGKPTRRGGFPADDSFDKPGTFLKLSAEVQRTILQERSSALSAAIGRLPPESAWKLYSHVPGLLTFMTLEVAHKIRAMARATGLYPNQVVDQLCAFKPLAFVHPGSLESRVGLCAKLTRMNRQQAVKLMHQHPQLWMMNSRLVAPRAEELSLMLSCCTVTALKLVASHPMLLTAQLPAMMQQLDKLSRVMGCGSRTAELVPLVVWQPGLLLTPRPKQQQLPSSSGDDNPGPPALQQPQQDDLAAISDTPEHVEQLLQVLAEQLQLPISVAQLMVLRAPELLASSHSSTQCGTMQQHQGGHNTADISSSVEASMCVSEAAAMLSDSWLCSEAARRQQYQQDLMRLITPRSARRKKPRVEQRQARTSKHKQQQQPQHLQQQQQQWLPVGVERYMAADASAYAAASCQWWTSNNRLQHSQQLTAMQQLVIQSPGLLLRRTAAPTSDTSAASANRLDTQLDELSQQLAKLLQATEPEVLQQQQQQQQTDPILRQLVQLTSSQEAAAAAPLYELLRQQISSAAVLEPSMLAEPVSCVVGQVSQLSRVLLLSPQQLWGMARHCPAVLWLTGPQLFERVRVLCGILRLSPSQVRQKVLAQTALPVLLLDVDALKDAIDDVLRVGAKCGVTEEVARQVVRDRPDLLLPGNIQVVRDVTEVKSS